VLASDEDSGSLNALRFSLASDIVELVVLTGDHAFLQTMRDAVGGARRLWHVPSADKVSDLLVAGEVGILVLDVQALNETPTVFVGQIKRQFPDLVVVAAGNRDDETSLASLISTGLVYRFIHKPMSPGRAKLFADAAVKKYEEQRRRSAATAPVRRASRTNRGALIGSAIGTLGVIAVATWALHRKTHDTGTPHPAGDNALNPYLQAQAQNPADPVARSGLAEVRERLLARAENALLEERLDEAALAIETARLSGVESGRIAFLTAQLAKSRDRVKAGQAAARVIAKSEPKPDDKVSPLLQLAAQRTGQARLIDPEGDSALFYIQEALKLDPNNDDVQDAANSLAIRLLTEVHSAIDHRDFVHASAWLDAAGGIAAPANVDALRTLLASARRQADTDAWTQLLRNATDRLEQDRLIEPANDSAKYYLMALRDLDPGNAGLRQAMQDLGSRLVSKAHRALTLEQYDAAHSWLNEADAIGFASAESNSVRRDSDAAAARQQFLSKVVGAGALSLLKSVQPVYPAKAELSKIQGWVELDFTVAESGDVKDIAVRSASTPGVFDGAAISALSQWRYTPVLRDGKPVPQRARIRIRFTLAR
jgi:TonB family protein